LHIDDGTDPHWISEVIRITNETNPDIIVFLGDFTDGHPSSLGEKIKKFRSLTAKSGIYGVPGNHDYFSDYSGWMRIFHESGITMLCNSSVSVPGTNGLIIAGITDPAAKRVKQKTPDLSEALKGIEKNSPVILLSHRPYISGLKMNENVDFQVSGHTHGGMIPGLSALVAR